MALAKQYIIVWRKQKDNLLWAQRLESAELSASKVGVSTIGSSS